jgi:hypothetical protein
MLRRRASMMGRAALEVLTDPKLPYTGQALIFCSRLGELARTLGLQEELARTGQVSPQQFSMAVHNAIGGLFLMDRKQQAPLTALAGGEATVLAGWWEAEAQLDEPGVERVWLLYAEEPLPAPYCHFLPPQAPADRYCAILLELAASNADGMPSTETFALQFDAAATETATASPLDLLCFLLSPSKDTLALGNHDPASGATGRWLLTRTADR